MRGIAETDELSAKCECRKVVNYTCHVIQDELLHRIAGSYIRREVLRISILSTAVNDVITHLKRKEMARNAFPSSNMSSLSSFKTQQSRLSFVWSGTSLISQSTGKLRLSRFVHLALVSNPVVCITSTFLLYYKHLRP